MAEQFQSKQPVASSQSRSISSDQILHISTDQIPQPTQHVTITSSRSFSDEAVQQTPRSSLQLQEPSPTFRHEAHLQERYHPDVSSGRPRYPVTTTSDSPQVSYSVYGQTLTSDCHTPSCTTDFRHSPMSRISQDTAPHSHGHSPVARIGPDGAPNSHAHSPMTRTGPDCAPHSHGHSPSAHVSQGGTPHSSTHGQVSLPNTSTVSHDRLPRPPVSTEGQQFFSEVMCRETAPHFQESVQHHKAFLTDNKHFYSERDVQSRETTSTTQNLSQPEGQRISTTVSSSGFYQQMNERPTSSIEGSSLRPDSEHCRKALHLADVTSEQQSSSHLASPTSTTPSSEMIKKTEVQQSAMSADLSHDTPLTGEELERAVSSLQSPVTSDKPHLCMTCFKAFKNKPQLSQHSLVHTGIRKHRCPSCDKSFKQLCHLQQHLRIHTGERPYKCTIEGCTRSFIQLSNLLHHLRNHEEHVKRDETRHYRCHICGRSFTNESSLTAHTLKMHDNLHVDLGSLLTKPKKIKKKTTSVPPAESVVTITSSDEEDQGPSGEQGTKRVEGQSAFIPTSFTPYHQQFAPLSNTMLMQQNMLQVPPMTGFSPYSMPVQSSGALATQAVSSQQIDSSSVVSSSTTSRPQKSVRVSVQASSNTREISDISSSTNIRRDNFGSQGNQ